MNLTEMASKADLCPLLNPGTYPKANLPDWLLEELKQRDKVTKCIKNLPIIKAAGYYGINIIDDKGFPGHHNLVIDLLDRDYPGWRGYTIEYTDGRIG